MRTEIKKDYQPPYGHREQSNLRKFINSWGGFIIVILILIFGGSEF